MRRVRPKHQLISDVGFWRRTQNRKPTTHFIRKLRTRSLALRYGFNHLYSRATDNISPFWHPASVAEHPSLYTDARLSIPRFCNCLQPLGLLQQSPAPHWYPASPVSPKCRSKAHLQPETLRPHHWRAHLSPFAPRAAANYIQGGDADVPCTARLCTTILGVVIHTCVADMPHRRRLRSASTERLDVPTCRRSTVGARAFPVSGAKVWNGLPSDITPSSSLAVFKNRLKTYLFRRCYETVWLCYPHFLFPVIMSPLVQWSLQ